MINSILSYTIGFNINFQIDFIFSNIKKSRSLTINSYDDRLNIFC